MILVLVNLGLSMPLLGYNSGSGLPCLF
jgi:hypothetical protein